MPRPSRIHYFSAISHVMIRGNYKQNIFFENIDREFFLSLLERTTTHYDCKIHLFCLMDNHVHFVIEVGQIPLSKIMQSIMTTYSMYLNRKQNKSGHLFQGRYKSLLIQNENYLAELCFYIHMNPITAGITDILDKYPWSSHHHYSKNKFFSWITSDLVEEAIRKLFHNEQNAYLKFMTSHHMSEKISNINFDTNGILTINNKINKKINTRNDLSLSHLSIDEIKETVCKELNIEKDLIASTSQKKEVVFARCMIAYFAHYYGKYFLKEIAYSMARCSDTISRTMHKQLIQAKTNPDMSRTIKLLHAKFAQYN